MSLLDSQFSDGENSMGKLPSSHIGLISHMRTKAFIRQSKCKHTIQWIRIDFLHISHAI